MDVCERLTDDDDDGDSSERTDSSYLPFHPRPAAVSIDFKQLQNKIVTFNRVRIFYITIRNLDFCEIGHVFSYKYLMFFLCFETKSRVPLS